MADDVERKLRVEPLSPGHDRSGFASGAEPLDRYLQAQAGRDARRNMAAPFVLLLPDALYRAVRSEIASFAVIVDARDDRARRFHERESLLPFPDRPTKLFRPLADLRQLFEEQRLPTA